MITLLWIVAALIVLALAGLAIDAGVQNRAKRLRCAAVYTTQARQTINPPVLYGIPPAPIRPRPRETETDALEWPRPAPTPTLSPDYSRHRGREPEDE